MIGERPNRVPTGLGNGTSGVDMTSFVPAWSNADDGRESPTPWGIANGGVLGDEDEENEDVGSDQLEDESTRVTKGDKGKSKGGKTSARPGTSRPAASENPKKRKMDEFAELAAAEEKTRQSELNVQKEQIEERKTKLQAKKADTDYKHQKLVYKQEKERNKRLMLEMMKARMGGGGSGDVQFQHRAQAPTFSMAPAMAAMRDEFNNFNALLTNAGSSSSSPVPSTPATYYGQATESFNLGEGSNIDTFGQDLNNTSFSYSESASMSRGSSMFNGSSFGEENSGRSSPGLGDYHSAS